MPHFLVETNQDVPESELKNMIEEAWLVYRQDDVDYENMVAKVTELA
jgi:hypothetical protein